MFSSVVTATLRSIYQDHQMLSNASRPHIVIPGLTRNPFAFQYENGFLLSQE
jgi:hypothetical protein